MGDLDGVSGLGASFLNLIFYGVSDTMDIPEDKSNVFRADLFALFPNLVEIELWTSFIGCYPLNLLSLLSVLNEADIPPSFQRLRMRDYFGKWTKRAVSA